MQKYCLLLVANYYSGVVPLPLFAKAMLIVGITGPLAAGKGTIVEYLTQKKGFQHLSVRAFLIQEIEKRGMLVNRDSMVIVANDLRSIHSPSYIVEQLYTQAKKSGKATVIESLRAVGEVEGLRALSSKSGGEKFYLFAVDASPKLRYQRAVARGSETDKVSYEEFMRNEEREMHNQDPTKQNIARCMELSDHVFSNNEDIENLYEQIEKVLRKLGLSQEQSTEASRNGTASIGLVFQKKVSHSLLQCLYATKA